MHSLIIQVSSEPVMKDDYIGEGDISVSDYGSFGIDYVDEDINEDAVDVLLEMGLPNGFSINKEERSIEWDRSLAFVDEYKRKIAMFLDKLQKSTEITMPAFRLHRMLNECFFFPCLIFCRSDNAYGCEYPMDFIADLMHEKKMYIGGCLDYHF